jgi:hypothetical protein
LKDNNFFTKGEICTKIQSFNAPLAKFENLIRLKTGKALSRQQNQTAFRSCASKLAAVKWH